MKIWYDKNKLNLNEFKSEKFLFLPLYKNNIVQQDKNFINNNWDIKPIFTDNKNDADVLVYHDKLDSNIISYLDNTNNKPILAFYNDDNSKPINDSILEKVIVYRTSINRSKQKDNEYALPAWSVDFGKADIREKKDLTISFCGALTDPVRNNCIEKFKSNKNITTNFIIRNAFWGGKPHDKKIRDEYISNLKDSDLVLCCRGAGNFSYRLYETLSVGRIPIIIDTDISLPCSDVIDWNRFIFTTPENIDVKVVEWWNSLTNNEYIDLQNYSREIYEKILSPSGFFNYLSNNWSKK